MGVSYGIALGVTAGTTIYTATIAFNHIGRWIRVYLFIILCYAFCPLWEADQGMLFDFIGRRIRVYFLVILCYGF